MITKQDIVIKEVDTGVDGIRNFVAKVSVSASKPLLVGEGEPNLIEYQLRGMIEKRIYGELHELLYNLRRGPNLFTRAYTKKGTISKTYSSGLEN